MKSSNGLGFMAVQSSSQKIVQQYGLQKKRKKIVNSVLNLRKAIHFWFSMLKTQVYMYIFVSIYILLFQRIFVALIPDFVVLLRKAHPRDS